MERESIRVTRSVSLSVSEIEIRVSRSSGPGGQHAQKSSTRVEAVFDAEASGCLSDVQKRRVLGRVGPVLRAVAQDERSQLRNRELAVERLVEKLRAALAVPRRRVATKPTAKAQRVQEQLEKYPTAKVTDIEGALNEAAQQNLIGVERKLVSVQAPAWLHLAERSTAVIAPKPKFEKLG